MLWRKLSGLLVLAKWRAQLTAAMGSVPCAAMGVCFLRLRSAPNWTLPMTPLFFSGGLQAAHRVDPLLGKSIAACLRRPSGTVLLTSADSREFLPTSRGIPQRDPLRSVLFSLALSSQPTPDRGSLGSLDAYADDAILCTTPELAGAAFVRWRDRLGDLGLELNPEKTVVWQPGADHLPASLCPFLSASCFRSEGLTICGLPIAAGVDPTAFDIPVGCPEFLCGFLDNQWQCTNLRKRPSP